MISKVEDIRYEKSILLSEFNSLDYIICTGTGHKCIKYLVNTNEVIRRLDTQDEGCFIFPAIYSVHFDIFFD